MLDFFILVHQQVGLFQINQKNEKITNTLFKHF